MGRGMAYDEDLANRVREQLADNTEVTEKRMFGGLAFLVRGNMSVAVSGQGGLLVRVGPDGAAEALSRPHCEQAEMRGRAMVGWVRVAAEGARTRPQVASWVRRGASFAATLPPKG
jgi:TfoX/Sxy family transcriptional regulator of competence genes